MNSYWFFKEETDREEDLAEFVRAYFAIREPGLSPLPRVAFSDNTMYWLYFVYFFFKFEPPSNYLKSTSSIYYWWSALTEELFGYIEEDK